MIIRNLRAFMIISPTIEIYNKHKSLPVWLWDKSYFHSTILWQCYQIGFCANLCIYKDLHCKQIALCLIALNHNALHCIFIALNCIHFKCYTASFSVAVFLLLPMSFTSFQHLLSTMTLHWNCLRRLNSHFKKQLSLFFLCWAAVSLQSSVLRPASGRRFGITDMCLKTSINCDFALKLFEGTKVTFQEQLLLALGSLAFNIFLVFCDPVRASPWYNLRVP